jgi:hypothetical protein
MTAANCRVFGTIGHNMAHRVPGQGSAHLTDRLPWAAGELDRFLVGHLTSEVPWPADLFERMQDRDKDEPGNEVLSHWRRASLFAFALERIYRIGRRRDSPRVRGR